MRAQGRLQTPEEFGDIVVRANTDGSFVRVKDIARIELGAQTYDITSRLNGQPAAVLGIYQLPGSNAVQAAEAVRKFMAEAKQQFPADMEYVVSLDQTLSVTEGMHEILKTIVRSARACCSRCFHFSARLARDPHSVVRGPGVVDWHASFCFRYLAFPSTRSRSSVSSSRSVWSLTMPLLLSKQSNITSKKE